MCATAASNLPTESDSCHVRVERPTWRSATQEEKEEEPEAQVPCYSGAIRLFFGLPVQPDTQEWWCEQVRRDPFALSFAPAAIQDDRDVVLAAAAMNPLQFKFASARLRGEKDVVLEILKYFGEAIKYASEECRSDTQVVAAAVESKRSGGHYALKYAVAPLNQDLSFLVTSNLFSDPLNLESRLDIVLSVKFSLKRDSSLTANEVLLHMKQHEYFETRRIYFPNNLSKGFCGWKRQTTNLDGHCRGTCGIKCTHFFYCPGTPDLNGLWVKCGSSHSEVTNHSCWAFSFRSHLERLKKHDPHGIMVQIEEWDEEERQFSLGLSLIHI